VFSESTAFYDALYASIKDYAKEAAWIAARLRVLHPAARTVLDAGCGTGEHARLLAASHGYAVDGFDLDPGMIAVAAARNPQGRFRVGDMVDFAADSRYDAVLCLFSSIGYVRTTANLLRAFRSFRRCLEPDGILLVEPWFPPGALAHGHVSTLVADAGDGVKVCRVSRTVVEGTISRLEFEYLIGEPGGIRRASEVHELGLFTHEETLAAFRAAGFEMHYDDAGPTGRGLWAARPAAELDR
jgi:SAM-dependent methyltransferase